MNRAWPVGCLLAAAAWTRAADAPQAGSEAPVAVAKAELCAGVSGREPVDARPSPAEFEAGTGRVFYWNLIRVAQPPAELKHVWSLDGRPVGEVALALAHPRTRTWSSKKVRPGAWKVEAVGPDGEVLQSAEFTVK